MVSMFAKLLSALNSDSAPGQVALAFALSLITGLTPLFSLHNIVILLLACVLKINFSAFLLGTLFFSGVAYLVDPATIYLGELILASPDLQPIFTQLYQSDFWRATRFNHTLVMGSFAVAVIGFIPVLVLSRYLILGYRVQFMGWVNKWKLTQFVKASKFYKVYDAFAD